MIMSDRFYNDPFWVQRLQNDLYMGIVSLPFDIARKLYLNAEQILVAETQLGQDCTYIVGIDHRTLQSFHDAIAAKFRYENRNDFEMHLPGILGGITEDDYIKQRWLRFYRNQIGRLFYEYKNLPREIIIAVTYRNPNEKGKKAEDNIDIISNSIYSSIKEKEKDILFKNRKMREDSTEDSELD